LIFRWANATEPLEGFVLMRRPVGANFVRGWWCIGKWGLIMAFSFEYPGVFYYQFDPALLGPLQTATWGYGWFAFDEARYISFDASPDDAAVTGGSFGLEVARQWTERVPGGGTTYLVTYRNLQNTPVVFRPRMIIVPPLRWGGGGRS
jgi:hypothetical protein